MLFRQFCRLRPTSSRGWSWHSVPVSKRRGAFSSIPSRDFRKIYWAQPSSLKHQRRSDKMVSFRDYEIYLLFLLLVKFHRSGKLFSRTKDFAVFFTMCHFRLRHRKRRSFISNVMFVKMISELQGVFQQFLYFKIRYDLGFQSRDKWGLNNYDAI